MQIIFFNINQAKIDREGILDFFNRNKHETSIFCLQESADIEETLLDKELIEFNKFSATKAITVPDTFSISTYILKNIEITKNENLFMNDNFIAPAIYTQIRYKENSYNIINYHGLSRPVEKLDSPERIEASNKLVTFLNTLDSNKVLGGDFNLLPNTQSIEIFERNQYINLIKKFSIDTTRNEVAWSLYPDTKHYFSDYVFVDENLSVESFEVPYCEISDHLPLILNIKKI